MKYKPHSYQQYAIERIVEEEAVGLFLDMGLGKTVVTLTAIDEMMHTRFEIARALVIAPLRVASDTWTREASKWDHLHHLKIARVLGSEKQRLAALGSDADVFVINRENVPWLVKHCTANKKDPWPFDMVVIDELSSFKSPSAQRFKALRKVRPLVSRMVGLTGTPAPNGYIDLWPQIYLLDQGERLGRTVTSYRNTFFHPGRMDRSRNIIFQWDINKGAKEEIDQALSDLCVSMTAADYLDMPERLDVTTPVALTPEQRRLYDQLERDYLITLDEDVLTAGTAAAITGKLQQFSQGAVYVTDPEKPEDKGRWTQIHDAKLCAMDDLVEAANGRPLLVLYWFRHDLARLKERYPKARILETNQDIEDWNTGKVEMLLAHPGSAGHGLNLQDGGSHAVWFSLPWSLELYQQANARLYRQGQRAKTVVIQHLVTEGTVDEDIMKALQSKAAGQSGLIEALKARMKEAKR